MTDLSKIISEWDTPAMAVFATELVCGKCHNDMGAVIFEKEESSTPSHNQITNCSVRVVFKS
ncbi:MAG: hypothetical protein M3Y53_03415 [Thermoproteota archaeon]|nr:hypothetical protein [Thermoproteota archaeon]